MNILEGFTETGTWCYDFHGNLAKSANQVKGWQFVHIERLHSVWQKICTSVFGGNNKQVLLLITQTKNLPIYCLMFPHSPVWGMENQMLNREKQRMWFSQFCIKWALHCSQILPRCYLFSSRSTTNETLSASLIQEQQFFDGSTVKEERGSCFSPLNYCMFYLF